MRNIYILAVAAACSLAGCAADQPQTSPPIATSNQAAPVTTVKLTADQELAKYCRVCVVDKQEKIEEYFPSRLDTKHQGKTYKFCADDCKKKFDANMARYAVK